MKILSLIGRGVKSFVWFWWDFIVGEDALIALLVIVGLAVVYALHHAGTTAWWALPIFWVVALMLSLFRVVQKARATQRG